MDMCIHFCVFICVYNINIDILFSDRKKIRAGCWRFSTLQVGEAGFKCGTIIKECRSIPWSSLLRDSRASTFWFPILVPMLPCGPAARRGEKSGKMTEALRIGSQKGCRVANWHEDVIEWMMWTTECFWIAFTEGLNGWMADLWVCWDGHLLFLGNPPWLGNLQSWPLSNSYNWDYFMIYISPKF